MEHQHESESISALFAGSGVIALWFENTLVVLDAYKGTIKWSQLVPTLTRRSVQIALIGANLFIFSEGDMSAFDWAYGSPLWTYYSDVGEFYLEGLPMDMGDGTFVIRGRAFNDDCMIAQMTLANGTVIGTTVDRDNSCIIPFAYSIANQQIYVQNLLNPELIGMPWSPS